MERSFLVEDVVRMDPHGGRSSKEGDIMCFGFWPDGVDPRPVALEIFTRLDASKLPLAFQDVEAMRRRRKGRSRGS